MRTLIVNADDFGRSPGVNRGVVYTHENGIVTSASLMVRWPASREAAAYARTHPSLSVGLHVDLGEWVCHNGEWTPVYLCADPEDAGAVAEEVERQLCVFRELTCAEPTHLDSHQHAHRNEPALSILRRWSERLDIPLRCFSADIGYRGDFYGQDEDGNPAHERILPSALARFFLSVPPGITEMACHPAASDDFASAYSVERRIELATLCCPSIQESVAAAGLRLASFHTRYAGRSAA